MARRNLVLLIVVAAGVAAGCSSGPEATGPDSVPLTVAPTIPADAPPATLGMPVGAFDPTDPYCQALGSIEALDAVQQLAGDDPGAVQAAVDVATAAVEQIAMVAPSEIAADWAVIATAYGELFGAYQDAGYDFAAMMANPATAGLLEQLGGRQMVEAADRVEQHAQAACQVSVGLGRLADTDTETETALGAGSGGSPPEALSPDAAEPVAGGADLPDDEAARIGALLLAEFALSATTEQQICFGRAISDPATVEGATGEDAEDPFAAYRALAGSCGIDTTPLG